jgi:hypothetical protein
MKDELSELTESQRHRLAISVDIASINRERIDSDADYRAELRHRCITDGFFLAPLLGFDDFRLDVHQRVKDLYVEKCPGRKIEDQHPIKNRMHLDPRHTFKTSWGIIDTVQWICTDPDITIVNETATQPLGAALTRRTAKIFTKAKNGYLTIFQRIFPELVIEKTRATYRAPSSTRDEIEPTLYSTSVGSAQSGWHPWIINPDDMVDTENSGLDASDASRERVWNTYTTNANTLRTGGYTNVRGTRYHPFDAYGRMLNTMEEGEWKTLIRSSLIVKSGDRLVEGEFPAEEDMTLLFPEMLPYKSLRSKFRADYRIFMCQQQNDPQGGGVSLFPAAAFRQATLDGERVPATGDVKICWRLQCDAKPYMARYAEGAAVLYAGSRVYVVDSWRGVYTPTELCERIVRGCKKAQCGDVVIENTPGSESMIPHIYNEATRQNWSLRIERPEFEMDDAIRSGRMKNLQPMMRAGRLWFSTWSGQSDELQNQFTNFGMVESNGLVDVISRLALRIPIATFKGHVSEEDRVMHQVAKDNAWYSRIYGEGGAAEVEAAIEAPEPVQARSYGLRPMLGGLNG